MRHAGPTLILGGLGPQRGSRKVYGGALHLKWLW